MPTISLPMAGREPRPSTSRASDSLTVQDVYAQHFDFVWRSARRLGMRPPQLEDVVQEVFMVVQRRLTSFEGRSTLRTWLFAITRHIVHGQFRRSARRSECASSPAAEPLDERCPEAQLSAREDLHLLHALLDELDDGLREVFILAQLEEMSGPEIAQALDLPVRAVYSRIVSAQKAFDQALRRARARERGGP
jgi:RNA polymerase sigma-70 factor (ECF subfamily)